MALTIQRSNQENSANTIDNESGNCQCILDPKINLLNFASFHKEIYEIWKKYCLDHPYGLQKVFCDNLRQRFGIDEMSPLSSINPKRGILALDQFIRATYASSINKNSSSCDFGPLGLFRCGRSDFTLNEPKLIESLKEPIRAVSVRGLFVLEPWITPTLFQLTGYDTNKYPYKIITKKSCSFKNSCDQIYHHWESWYNQNDFDDMQLYGINTIRLPIGYWYFEEISCVPSGKHVIPLQSLFSDNHPIATIVSYAQKSNLNVILDLHIPPISLNETDEAPGSGSYHVYLPDQYSDVTVAIRSAEAVACYISFFIVERVHDVDPDLAVFVPDTVCIGNSINDCDSVSDSDSDSDSEEMTTSSELCSATHESSHHYNHNHSHSHPIDDEMYDQRRHLLTCEKTLCAISEQDEHEPVEEVDSTTTTTASSSSNSNSKKGKNNKNVKNCQSLPSLVEFSLSFDNCHPTHPSYVDNKNSVNNNNNNINNNGDHCFNMTRKYLESDWWTENLKAFAQLQMYTYEQKLGWVFSTYKLEASPSPSLIAPAAYLWSFKLAVEKGYFDISTTTSSGGGKASVMKIKSICDNIDSSMLSTTSSSNNANYPSVHIVAPSQHLSESKYGESSSSSLTLSSSSSSPSYQDQSNGTTSTTNSTHKDYKTKTKDKGKGGKQPVTPYIWLPVLTVITGFLLVSLALIGRYLRLMYRRRGRGHFWNSRLRYSTLPDVNESKVSNEGKVTHTDFNLVFSLLVLTKYSVKFRPNYYRDKIKDITLNLTFSPKANHQARIEIHFNGFNSESWPQKYDKESSNDTMTGGKASKGNAPSMEYRGLLSPQKFHVMSTGMVWAACS
eukprot:gene3981-7933_t